MNTNGTSRWLRLLAALLALALLSAACGGSDDDVEEATDSDATSETADDAEPDEADDSADAGGECGTSAVVAPDAPVTDLTVAMVAPSDSEDRAFTQSMVDSLTRLGVEPQVTDGTFQVEIAADAIRGYAEDGIDVVIVHGTQYGGSLAEIAPDFPETSFVWGTSTTTNDIPNVFAYYPAAEEGGYVNGWMAGAIADGGDIGVVGPVEAGDAVAYINGFAAGAEANGAGNVGITYTGSFSEVALATEAAEAFLTTGVEVLTGTSQSTIGAVNVAAQNDIPWFGTQSNQEPWSSDLVVASQVYRWDVVLDDMFEMIEAGTLGGEAMVIDLANGGLVIEMNSCYDLDDEIMTGAQDIIDQIIAGEIDPPA